MSIKFLIKPIRKPLFFSALMLAAGMYACSDKQATQEQGSNVGGEQTEMTVDTTASGGFGGTDKSTGRADADTSGTGRQMSADTTKK